MGQDYSNISLLFTNDINNNNYGILYARLLIIRFFLLKRSAERIRLEGQLLFRMSEYMTFINKWYIF